MLAWFTGTTSVLTMIKFWTRLSRLSDTGGYVSRWYKPIRWLTLTDNLVLERLVLPNCVRVAFALMLLAIEVLDCLIVEQAVRVDAAGNLCRWLDSANVLHLGR